MRKPLIVSLTLACVCLLAGAATAQESEYFYNIENLGTPDGQTPSEETACDGQTGAAHGLCTAFCEAMDCDSGDPQASQNACDRVQSRYEQITGSPPPCLCPCVEGVPGWSDALNGDVQFCSDFPAGGGGDFVGIFLPNGQVPGAQDLPDLGFGFCGFAFGTGPALLITPEEAQNCNNLVRQKAAQAGVECVPTLP